VIGSHPAGALVAVPGLLLAANVAVCAPVVTALLTINADLPGTVPLSRSGVVPSVLAFNVSVIPEPPALGAGITTSPVGEILTPNALSEEVPTVDSCETYGSTNQLPLLLKNCTR
jgi:hypothetical protein